MLDLLSRCRGIGAPRSRGFGTGKTILLHQIADWAAAEVIVFVGCGERGNEMTRMLRELPRSSTRERVARSPSGP